MLLLTISVLCIFRAAGRKSGPPDDIEKETRYFKAFGVISQAFDWSEEEVLYRHSVRNPSVVFGYQNYTWAVGLRGRNLYGRRYTNRKGTSGCMATMVHPTAAMTTCACVFSWYISYTENPMNVTMFIPHPSRTIHDITAPYLFIHHTLHTGRSYFVDEDIRYYGIVNNPIPTPNCHRRSTPQEQESALVLLEVETPVVIENIPAVMPNNIVKETWTEVRESSNLTGFWTMRLLTYGTRFIIENNIIIPKAREPPLMGQRLDLRDELISYRLIPAHGIEKYGEGCDRARYNFSEPGKECWKAYPDLQLCHLLAGSPIVTNNGFAIYGILTNEVLCADQPDYLSRPSEHGTLQVKRLAGEFAEGYLVDGKGTVVDRLLSYYKKRVDKKESKKAFAAKPQPLFNYSAGQIYYDEDFVPQFLGEIKSRSRAIQWVCSSLGSAVPFIGLIYLSNFHY